MTPGGPNPSEYGRMLAPVVGHVRRKSAVRQAAMWNDVLRKEAVQAAEPAYVVEVSERGPDRLWRLVWRQSGDGRATVDKSPGAE